MEKNEDMGHDIPITTVVDFFSSIGATLFRVIAIGMAAMKAGRASQKATHGEVPMRPRLMLGMHLVAAAEGQLIRLAGY